MRTLRCLHLRPYALVELSWVIPHIRPAPAHDIEKTSTNRFLVSWHWHRNAIHRNPFWEDRQIKSPSRLSLLVNCPCLTFCVTLKSTRRKKTLAYLGGLVSFPLEKIINRTTDKICIYKLLCSGGIRQWPFEFERGWFLPYKILNGPLDVVSNCRPGARFSKLLKIFLSSSQDLLKIFLRPFENRAPGFVLFLTTHA